jgi:hypothetical protein
MAPQPANVHVNRAELLPCSPRAGVEETADSR